MLMNQRAIRWGDNDHYFGPLTWSISSYKPWALVLKSRGDDDHDRGCHLRISLRSLTLIVALPNIIKPHMDKVYPDSWDAATVERLGRNWYWNVDPREYGFSCSDGHFNVYYGRTGGSACDSSIEQRWSCFLPWTQWRHIRRSFYGLQGEHLYDEPQGPWGKLGDTEWHDRWTAQRAREDAVPTASFAFKDFDGEALTVTTKIEEREWRFGTGYFKWLSVFRRPKISRSLDLSFSNETGRRKGSWKGGTIGHSIEMQPGELHESAFKRYCAEHEMTFMREPEQPAAQ